MRVQKRWRELPIKEKLEIPSKIFNIDKKDVEKIRKIEDPKERLIKAARLQYELFEDIHSYITAWIAGYASDVAIRQYFGSTKKLLDLFMKFPELPKEIKPSWADLKRKIKIPREITSDLAEEIGIHVGDGNIYSAIQKDGFRSSQYTISGDLTDEYEYHTNHIKKLFKKLYNIEPSLLKRINKNNIDSRIKSKAIIEFKTKILGLPIGSKRNITIPKEILKNDEFKRRFVVGIIDTDFSITKSLAITGKLHSLKLVKQISNILEENQITHILNIYEDYGRFYINKQGAIRIIKDWKLNNSKHLSKYLLLRDFKKFVPYSTTTERFAVLEGKLEIDQLEEICKKRHTSPA